MMNSDIKNHMVKPGQNLIAGISILILLTAFLWSAQIILSPLLIGILLLYILSGLRSNVIGNRMFFAVLIMLWVYIILKAQSLLFPILVSFVLAYLFDPFADQLEKLRIPRLLAVIIILILTLGILIITGMLLVPNLINEIQNLIGSLSKLPDLIMQFGEKNLPKTLDYLHMDTDHFKQQVSDTLPNTTQQVLSNLLKSVKGIGSFFSQILNIVLIPVLTFYFLKDFNKIQDWVLTMTSRKYRSTVAFYSWRMNRILGGYLRGQIIVCTIVGLLTGGLYAAFKIPFAILLGLITGILNIVPFIGLYTGLALAFLVCFLTANPLAAMIKVVLITLVVQNLESSVISPKIVGDRVGLHPIAVILSILLFSKFFGFWGLIIGVPTAALIKFLLDEWKRRQVWEGMRQEKYGTQS